MSIIDSRGLLFGKVNLIDALVGLVLILLIPVGYGAYALFRVPNPTITAVEPASVPRGTRQVRLLGDNLRPFLRPMLGTERGTFLLGSTTEGVIELPTLPAGTYDLVLYDVSQEVARLSDALTVEPPPPLVDQRVIVTGAFYPLEEAAAYALAGRLKTALGKPADWGSVLDFGSAEFTGSAGYRLSAMLELRCALVHPTCLFSAAQAIAPDQRLAIPVSDTTFIVERVFPPEVTPVEIVIRTVIRSEIVSLLQRSGGLTTVPARTTLGPSLLSFEVIEEIAGDATLAERQAGRLTIAMTRVRAPATETSTGWKQAVDNQSLKIGAQYTFETNTYVLRGEIIDLTVRSRPTPSK